MRKWMVRSFCLLLLLLPAAARAQQADDAKEAEARFASGQAHLNNAEHAAAVADFEEAYRRNPEPKYLFHLAEAHRLAGNLERALFYYKSYLRAQPDAPNRAEVDGNIAALDQQIAAKKAAAEAPPPPP